MPISMSIHVVGSGTAPIAVATPPTLNCPIDVMLVSPTEFIVIELIGVELSAKKPKKFGPFAPTLNTCNTKSP